MARFPCVTWIFGVLGEQCERLCNVVGFVFVEDVRLNYLIGLKLEWLIVCKNIKFTYDDIKVHFCHINKDLAQ
jgi:hypothetical protein